MKIPAWLDPWWHIDYEVSSALSPQDASVALLSRKGRLRGRRSGDVITLERRSALINRFVIARGGLDARPGATLVSLRIQRPAWVRFFFAFTFLFLVAYPLLQVLLTALFDRPRLLQSATFWAIGAFIWVAVIATNYASARREATHLRRLIDQALGVGP